MDNTYLFNSRDEEIISSSIKLLWKIIRSKFVTSQQVEHIARLLTILESLPNKFEPVEIAISLIGPDKWFGEHRISHSWEIRCEGEFIEISSHGYFFRESTGGDSFTSMSWSATPGEKPGFDDYLSKLSLVDDAMPFESEVQLMDLSETGYHLTVYTEKDELESPVKD